MARDTEETDGTSGDGLKSMRERAKELGETLELSCKPNQGTAIVLPPPLHRGVLKGFLKTT